MSNFPILYKYSSKKQIQQWQVIVNGDSFYTQEGIKGGKITQSLPTYCKGKNTGKKNATTNETQAIAEAKAKHQKKLDAGYAEILGEGKEFFKPMLAFPYEDYPLTDEDYENGVFIQPKLDGLRSANENNSIMSRNGKPFLACPHLYQDKFILDGELYNHELKDDFNKIVSLCKKAKPSEEELIESAGKVQMWVYDFPSHKGVFSARYAALKNALSQLGKPNLVLVPTYKVNSIEEIHEWHAKFLEEGYEGTIIRRNNASYENKRSKQLLKFKDFKDEEFKIIGAIEGVGGRTGTIGKFILQHDKVADQTFESNVKGGHDYLRQIWQERDSYIGKTATVKYFNRTPKKEDGGDVPRFPYIIKIDRESYE